MTPIEELGPIRSYILEVTTITCSCGHVDKFSILYAAFAGNKIRRTGLSEVIFDLPISKRENRLGIARCIVCIDARPRTEVEAPKPLTLDDLGF